MAPVINKLQNFPAGNVADSPFLFKSGFGLEKHIWSGPSQEFEWVTSGTNSNEFYLTKAGGGDPNLSITSNGLYNAEIWARPIIPVSFAGDLITNASVGALGASYELVVGVSEGHFYDLSGTLTYPSHPQNTGFLVTDANDSQTVLLETTNSTTGSSTTRNFSYNFIAYDGITNVRITLTPGGSSDPSLSAFSLVQEEYTKVTGVPYREGTVGSLDRFSYGYGDNDTLGYSTFYVRTFDADKPENYSYKIVFDGSSTGDGSSWEQCMHQWWVGATSTLGISDGYRYVNDPRREGILIDMMGAEPTSEKLSLMRGNAYIPVLGQGQGVVFYRCTNPSGQSATARWDVPVSANSRTEYTVGSGGDYSTLAAAETAQRGNNDIALRILSGHEETITTTIEFVDDNWKVYWNGVGTKPVFRSVTGPPASDVTPIQIDQCKNFIIDNIEFRPSAILDGSDDSSAPCIEVVRSELVAIVNSNMRAFGDANVDQYNNPSPGVNTIAGSNDTYNGFVSLSNFWNRTSSDSQPSTPYIDGLLIQNCWNDGQDAYFMSETNAEKFYTNQFVIGCSFGISDNESGIRQTSPCLSYHLLFNSIKENRKDVIRTVKGGYNTVYGNKLDGAYRHGATAPSPTRTQRNIISSNVSNRTTTASGLADFNISEGSFDINVSNNIAYTETNVVCFSLFNGVTRGQEIGEDSNPWLNATDMSMRVRMQANTVVRLPGHTTARLFGPNVAIPEDFGYVVRFNMISDESTGSISEYANMTNIDFGSNTTTQDWGISQSIGIPTLGTTEADFTPSILYDDIWGNVRGTTSALGAAIAPPNDEVSTPESFGSLTAYDPFGTQFTDGATFGLGDVQQDTIQNQNFVIGNSGPGVMEFVTVSITGDFAISQGIAAGVTLADGATIGLQTSLETITTGAKSSVLTLVTTNPFDSSFVLNLTGNVTDPAPADTRSVGVTNLDGTPIANGSTTDKGSHAIGSTLSIPLKITNTGSLTLEDFTFDFEGELSFGGVFFVPSIPTLAPGESSTITVYGNTDTAAALRTGTIIIKDATQTVDYRITFTYRILGTGGIVSSIRKSAGSWGVTTTKANRPTFLNPRQAESAVLTKRGWEVRVEGNGNPNATEVVVAGDFGYVDPDENEEPGIYLLTENIPNMVGISGGAITPINLEIIDTEKVLDGDSVSVTVDPSFPLPDGITIEKIQTNNIVELFRLAGTPTSTGSGSILLTFTDSYVPVDDEPLNTIDVEVKYNITSG